MSTLAQLAQLADTSAKSLAAKHAKAIEQSLQVFAKAGRTSHTADEYKGYSDELMHELRKLGITVTYRMPKRDNCGFNENCSVCRGETTFSWSRR